MIEKKLGQKATDKDIYEFVLNSYILGYLEESKTEVSFLANVLEIVQKTLFIGQMSHFKTFMKGKEDARH